MRPSHRGLLPAVCSWICWCNVFSTALPGAKIDQPFELGDNIDRIEIAPPACV
jgi:hypothetical protein